MRDLGGHKFGRLTALSYLHKISRWLCVCACGKQCTAEGTKLLRGQVVSCGCWRLEQTIARSTTHGGCGTSLHNRWNQMRGRCSRPNHHAFKNYGARGISVCAAWLDFNQFRDWALAHGYRPDLTLDRRNNNGGYSPENCRWVSRAIQGRNTRRTMMVEFDGDKIPLRAVAERTHINYATLYKRVVINKIPIAAATGGRNV